MESRTELTSDPSDFIGWYPIPKGRQMLVLAKEMGASLDFDEELPSVIILGHCTNRPEGYGAVRSATRKLDSFWREWKRRSPD